MPGLMAGASEVREGDKGLCALWKILQSKSLRLSFSLEIQDTTLLQIYWIAAGNSNNKKQKTSAVCVVVFSLLFKLC